MSAARRRIHLAPRKSHTSSCHFLLLQITTSGANEIVRAQLGNILEFKTPKGSNHSIVLPAIDPHFYLCLWDQPGPPSSPKTCFRAVTHVQPLDPPSGAAVLHSAKFPWRVFGPRP